MACRPAYNAAAAAHLNTTAAQLSIVPSQRDVRAFVGNNPQKRSFVRSMVERAFSVAERTGGATACRTMAQRRKDRPSDPPPPSPPHAAGPLSASPCNHSQPCHALIAQCGAHGRAATRARQHAKILHRRQDLGGRSCPRSVDSKRLAHGVQIAYASVAC